VKHQRAHKGEKIFKWKICRKVFVKRVKLVKQEQTLL
jgi:hypothetical protein